MWWIAVLTACGTSADNDLWLDIEGKDGGKLELHLPATWLLDHDTSVDFDTPDGHVDLKAEAQKLRQTPGRGSRSWTLASDARLTLREERPARGRRADRLRIGTSGDKGLGLGITVPLDAGGRCAKALGEHVQVEEIDVQFGPAFCAQLGRSEPATLVKVTGGLLGGLTIETLASED